MKKTKIICTAGPASFSKKILKDMFHAGMNGVRINTAYGNLSQYQSTIETVREIADIPIIVDVKGPEIRIKTSSRKLVNKEDVIEVGFGNEEIHFSHDFYDKIAVGDAVLIDNGKIRTRIIEKKNRKIQLRTRDSGVIEDGKGVNVPKKQLSVPSLSKHDSEIVEFAKKLDVEYIALSFTRSVKDVNALVKTHKFGGGIISKIENSEGEKNVKEILEVSSGLMVARGDLGVEIEPEKVPLVQKSLIKLCNQQGKLVVTATEMLESMIHQPNPTRAEVSDVANAILDGSDAVMLSGETAVGEYPVAAVEMITRIAHETEKAVKSNVEDDVFIDISDSISKAIQRISQTMPLDKVVTLTRSGYTARMITRLKLAQPVIAVTPDFNIKKQLELTFGLHPVLIDYSKEKDRIAAVAKQLYSMHLLSDDETVLFTSGVRTKTKHASNSIEIHKIKELRQYSSKG